MASTPSLHLYAINAAAQYLEIDRRTLRKQQLEPAAVLHLASGKTHPLHSQRQLDELAAGLAAADGKSAEALALRSTGATWQAVADALSYSSRSAARKAAGRAKLAIAVAK